MARKGTRDPLFERLSQRVYDRTDLVASQKPKYVLIAIILGVWLSFGAYNYLGPAQAIRAPQQRALYAFGFGPAFGPLQIARAGATLTFKLPRVGERRIATRQAALLGALPLGLCMLILFAGQEQRSRREVQRVQAQKFAREQGRPLPAIVVAKTRLRATGLPLGRVSNTVIGIPYGADAGHVGIIAPTRSGKGLHLTEALLAWPGGAVVVDPKAEQWVRTAGWRARHIGPVYRVPAIGIDLLDYFNLADALDLQELHKHLLRPWMDKESIFAEKALALFQAAHQVGQATSQHPLWLLAEWSQLPVTEVVQAAKRHAPRPIAVFLDGDDLEETSLNRFTQSAWGTFTTRFGPFVPHIDTVTRGAVTGDWAEQQATIYITYPLDQLAVAGALISAIIAGLIKGQMRQAQQGYKHHTLFAIDELPTVALFNLDTYLATVGSSGVTVLSYIQALSQLYDIYGQHKSLSILANWHHQIYYPPREPQTAKYVSEMFGAELQYTSATSISRSTGGKSSRQTSVSEQQSIQPALSVPQVLALPESTTVLFTTLAGAQYRALAERLNPIPRLAQLPPPPEAVPSVAPIAGARGPVLELVERRQRREVPQAQPVSAPEGAQPEQFF